MNYIVYDLEFNQAYSPAEDITISRQAKCTFEIIQIGAVKLNENINIKSSFNKFIKPTIYPYLHPFIKDLTGILEEDLTNAKTFDVVFNEFLTFVESKDNVLVVWGMEDIKEIIKNVNLHNINMNYFPLKYINLQQIINKKFNCKKGIKMGLKHAIELLNIKNDDNFHNAYNDAYYTAMIFKEVYSKDIKIHTYLPSFKQRRKNELKSNLDKESLFNQIEKMYNKNLTQVDKDIITTSYMMGKTNQFQKIINDNKKV